MTLQDHKVSFITKWQLVLSLEKYAAGKNDALNHIRPYFDSVAARELATEEGRTLVQRWLWMYYREKRSMAQFAATYRTTQYNRNHWQRRNHGVITMLNALERLLIANAIDRVKPKTAS